MKTLTSLLFAMSLITSQAADKPGADFPKVGDTYKIAVAAPLAETPFDNVITVLELGEHQWAKVSYETMTRSGKEKREMWVNFAHVTSAVKPQTSK